MVSTHRGGTTPGQRDSLVLVPAPVSRMAGVPWQTQVLEATEASLQI